MRILIATETYEPAINGVVTSTLTLKSALEQAGHEVSILTLSADDSEDLDNHVYAVRSISVNKLYPGARLSFSKKSPCIQKIINWQPDIIHTQGEFSTFRIARKIAKKLDIPIVHTYHTVYEDYTHYFSPSKRLGKKVVQALSKGLLEHTSQIIVPTQKVKHLLKHYGVRVPITVIPTGLPLQKFNVPISTAKKQSTQQQLEINASDFVLISLARIAKEKNIEELIHYVSQIDFSQLKLLIVGDGPYRETLEEIVRELGVEDKIRFAGMVKPEEVPLYYQLGDVFVSASTSETQGLTYVEAMASGLPALCRKDESITGVIQDGENGFQYQEFSEFKEHLKKLINDTDYRINLGTNARLFAFENYSAETFANKVVQVYEQAKENDEIENVSR